MKKFLKLISVSLIFSAAFLILIIFIGKIFPGEIYTLKSAVSLKDNRLLHYYRKIPIKKQSTFKYRLKPNNKNLPFRKFFYCQLNQRFIEKKSFR